MRVILYLQVRHFINILKHMLRTPKRLIPVIIIIVWFGLSFISFFTMGRMDHEPFFGDADPRYILGGLMIIVSLVAGFMLLHAFSESLLVFGMGEVDFLFPTPLPQRVVLGSKLIFLHLKVTANFFFFIFLFTFMLPGLSRSMNLFGLCLGLSLLGVILVNLCTAINLAASYRGRDRWWPVWIVRIVFYGAILLAAALIAPNFDPLGDLAGIYFKAVESPVLGIVMLPIKWAVLPAKSGVDAAFKFGGLIILAAASFYAVLTRNENPYEPSLSLSAHFSELRKVRRGGNPFALTQEQKREKAKRMRRTFSLPGFGRGASALLWKNLNIAVRKYAEWFFAIMGVIVVALVSLKVFMPGAVDAGIVSTGAMVIIGYAVYGFVIATRFFISSDVRQANILKPLPVPAWKLVAMMPLHNVIVLTFSAWCLIAVVSLTYGLPQSSPLPIIGVLMPLFIYSFLSAQIWVAVLYPDPNDFSQRTASNFISVGVLMFSLMITAAPGLMLWMFEASAIFIVMVVGFVCTMLSAAGILVSAELYKKYDPTNE